MTSEKDYIEDLALSFFFSEYPKDWRNLFDFSDLLHLLEYDETSEGTFIELNRNGFTRHTSYKNIPDKDIAVELRDLRRLLFSAYRHGQKTLKSKIEDL